MAKPWDRFKSVAEWCCSLYVAVPSTVKKTSNPRTKARSIRIAELCQLVAHRLRLSRKRIDDIRVAALLRDLESVEISTKLISRAVDTLERNASRAPRHTFLGTDLVHSLGTVLEGALPLIVSQNDDLRDCVTLEGNGEQNDVAGREGPVALRRQRGFEAGGLRAHSSTEAVRWEWQSRFTATGKAAMWVGKLSTWTARAVCVPP